MKNIDISKFPKRVQKEAALLLVHATKEERARLNFSDLFPSYPKQCIYGQMTYDCHSERSRTLMKLCFNKYSKKNQDSDVSYRRTFSQNIKTATPIEAAIMHPKYKEYNENLINYLQQDL